MRMLLDDGASAAIVVMVLPLSRFFMVYRPVTMIIDTSHELNDGYSQVITVDKARDSVDIKLINILTSEDIVVTQDYGVAAMALGKKAKAINQNGLIYSDSNIDELLFSRFIGQKLRRAGKSTNTAKKRTKEDDENFRAKFVMLLDGKK